MSQLTPSVNAKDHIQGKNDAPVTLVEYGDYECPYCGQAYPIIKELQKKVGIKLRLVFRNFPLSEVHPHALHAAYAAEAAAKQGQFWQMHDLLFENQEALEDQDLQAYANELSLEIRQFIKDMRFEAITNKVKDDLMNGVRSGANGTPTFFINGHRHDGSYELDFLLEAVKSEIKKKRGLKSFESPQCLVATDKAVCS